MSRYQSKRAALTDIKKRYDYRLILTGCLDAHDFLVVMNNAMLSLHKLDEEPEDSDRTEWIQFHLKLVQQAIDTLPDWAERRLTKQALEDRAQHYRNVIVDDTKTDRARRAAEDYLKSIQKELES